MITRSITQADLPALLTIENACQLFPWTADIFTQCFKSGYIGWGITDATAMVAFVMISLAMTECHILNLGVQPALQRQGLGQQVLLYALKQAKQKGASMAYLEVRQSNHPAIALYEKVGFVEIGSRTDYYQTKTGRENAVILAKDLSVDDELV